MKVKYISLLCSALLTGAVSADSVTNEIETTARCSLIDGSLLIGKPDLASFPFGSAFGDISVPLASLDSLDVEKKQDRTDPSNVVDRISTVLHLKNGDRLTTTPNFAEIGLQTSFGTVNLPIAQIETLQAKCNQVPQSNHHKDGLVFSCSFESEEELDALEAVHHTVQFVPGIRGNAALIPAGPREIVMDMKGLSVDKFDARGRIEFHARIPEPSNLEFGRGNLAFVMIRPKNDGFYVNQWIGFTHNDGLGHGGLLGRIFHGPVASTHGAGAMFSLKDILQNDPSGWHRYEMRWDSDGMGPEKHIIEVFVDGKLVCATSTPLGGSPEKPQIPFPTCSIHIADPHAGSHPALEIDELKVWNTPNR